MFTSVYDKDVDGTVDDSSKLQGKHTSQVQDHTPKTHTHTESQITDLDHDADKIKGIDVDAAAIADGKRLTYKSASGKIEYETPTAGGDTIVDRGDPAAVDWNVGSFTTDATWRELDCSAIVPAGAKAIFFRLDLSDDAVGNGFHLRENGNSNAINFDGLITQVASIGQRGTIFSFCDGDRKVEYYGNNVAFIQIDLTVCAWIL
jgi:hypothetical protein